ncbi:MAG: ribonuclease HIII [Opitutales bacterium]
MPGKRKQADALDGERKKKTTYTLTLDDDALEKLRGWCEHRLWLPHEVEYARFSYKGDGVNVTAYESGKVVIQGKKTEDFVTYVIEAEITHEPRLGYDEVHNPEWFEPHAGLDESGKGDFFGPLISACVIADGEMVRHWMEKGVTDSKRITSDAAIYRLEKEIRKTKGVIIRSTWAGMRRYNELYYKFGSNLNKLLAWMHAKSVTEALKERAVPWGLLDQFSKQPLVQRQLRDVGDFDLRMRTKAESDPVVAAASIVARAEYLRQMKKLEERFGDKLLKGASAAVKQQGRAIVEKFGEAALGDYAKLHFKTAAEVLGHAPTPLNSD